MGGHNFSCEQEIIARHGAGVCWDWVGFICIVYVTSSRIHHWIGGDVSVISTRINKEG